jgi:hypothetical protein
MKRKERYAVLLILAGLLPLYGQAQWSNSPVENTLVCNAEEDQREPAVITDGNGGVLISWRDYRYNSSIFGGDIVAQRLTNEGNAVWTGNGIAVNAGSLNKGHFRPVMAEDGYGGAVIGWGRSPGFLYNYDIFAQKLNGDGERKWSLNDVTVSDRPGTESFHQIIRDDSCGAILTWTHLPGTTGSTDIYAQRVDSAGSTLWENNGVEICMAAESQSYPKLTGDGQSGAIIAWADSRRGTGESDIYAQRVAHDGTVQWTTDGVEVTNYLYAQISPVIVSDGSGGAIIAWEDSRSGNSDIYAQRLNANGEIMWTEHGIPVCTAPQNQQSPAIVTDGEGGALIVWQDIRGGDFDIYAQRISGSGVTVWATNGMAVSAASGDQAAPVAISDSAGGIFITWCDYRSDPFGDIYAQHLNDAGESLWGDNGTAVCTASGYQESAVVAPDGDQGAVIVWADKRNGVDYDIYAQRIDKNGNHGVQSDEDNDGISDSEEQGPGGDNPLYDGNSDGIPDCDQGYVASFHTYNNQQYVTLSVPDSVLLDKVKAIGSPAPDAPGAPEEGSFPYGFFSFSITGLTNGSHTVATIILHNGPATDSYYKYGPTPAESTQWYEFSYDGETGAVFDEDTIWLFLTDGARGDSDITANGTIMEPGGPVVIASSVITAEPSAIGTAVIYPNPCNDNLKIDLDIIMPSQVVIDMFDSSGRKAGQLVKDKLPPGKVSLILDLSVDKTGVYYISITDGRTCIVKKIVKINQ